VRIDVLFGAASVAPADVAGRVVAVIDVLRASTTIATALDHGARSVIPFEGPDEAVVRSKQYDRRDVLLAGDGSDLKSVDGLTVAAEIIAQAKGEKVTVFKKRRRHNYRRKKGHRQQHTILKIVAIGDQKAEDGTPAKASRATAQVEAPELRGQVDAGATENPAPAAAKPKKAKAAKSASTSDGASANGAGETASEA